VYIYIYIQNKSRALVAANVDYIFHTLNICYTSKKSVYIQKKYILNKCICLLDQHALVAAYADRILYILNVHYTHIEYIYAYT